MNEANVPAQFKCDGSCPGNELGDCSGESWHETAKGFEVFEHSLDSRFGAGDQMLTQMLRTQSVRCELKYLLVKRCGMTYEQADKLYRKLALFPSRKIQKPTKRKKPNGLRKASRSR